MRCFSLISKGFLVPVAAHHGMVYGGGYVTDAYPTAKPGFELDATDRVLKVGFVERVAASDELLKLAPDGGAIERVGHTVRVLRASVKNDSGRPVLVPESADDVQDALVLIDVGSGHQTFVRYQCDEKTQLVCHSRADNEPFQQRILVRLKPFDTAVVALRSSQKWIFWGEERVKETLSIKYDGQNVFYDIQRAGR
jgi:hypothetical protein